MRKIYLLLILMPALLSAFASCSPQVVDEHLVVDGWIEDGGYPVVIVTSSFPTLEKEWTQDDLAKHVLHLATVTISDGDKTVTLVGQRNDDYFPPYIYSTVWMKGEAGKTYTLNVRYGKTEASSVTTIPAPQNLDDLRVAPAKDGFTLNARFTAMDESCYMFFTRREKIDSNYLPNMFSLIDGSAISSSPGGGSPVEVSLCPGFEALTPERYKYFFENGTSVSVRFCTVDRETFEYWKGVEESWFFSHNPFFPVTSGAPSNIRGGYGFWAGYGSTYYDVPAPPATGE